MFEFEQKRFVIINEDTSSCNMYVQYQNHGYIFLQKSNFQTSNKSNAGKFKTLDMVKPLRGMC